MWKYGKQANTQKPSHLFTTFPHSFYNNKIDFIFFSIEKNKTIERKNGTFIALNIYKIGLLKAVILSN
jgi:hypothetical protein